MKRRSFLESLLAGLAATTLPLDVLAAPAPDPIVWNTATLTSAMESVFSCRMGPPMAFFEMVKGTDTIIEIKPDQVLGAIEKPHPVDHERFIYQTYALGIEGGSAEEAEARLAKHFYDIFSQMPASKLVWRTKPQFVSDELVKYGDTWATAEEIEDGFKRLEDKPNDVEYDISWGNYRYVTEKVPLHKMRMRLVMTDLPKPVELDCIKHEGTTFTTRIS